MKYLARIVVACVLVLGVAVSTVGCNATPQTDPYRGIYTAATAEDVVVKDTTIAVKAHVISSDNGAKAYTALNLTAVGLLAAVPIADATGVPTPTAQQPNPITKQQLMDAFTTLNNDLATLASAVSGAVNAEVGALAAANKAPKK